MLQIRAIHLYDFGPFKDHQKIGFSENDGVTIIYGENMRGKTSLLNAIRFAFFGKVIGRGMKATSIHKIGNWEQAAKGKFGFEVQLEFLHEGKEHKLTRTCRPKQGITTPQGDEDYALEYFLECDGNVFGPQQAEAELKRILPEQISRFFLFDGELLQEYEDLLSNESDMGRRISEAIERILGVPVLTAARATLLRLKDKSEQKVALAAQGDQKTREFGNQLADLNQQRQVLQNDLVRHEADLEKMRSQKAALEEAMKKKERVAALLDKQDILDGEIKELEKKLTDKLADLRRVMSTAWSSLLSERMAIATRGLRQREDELQTAITRADVLKKLVEGSSNECPACLQVVSAQAKLRIQESLTAGATGTGRATETELNSVRRKLEALRYYASINNEVLRLHWQALEEVEIDLSNKRGEKEEIDKQLENVDEEALRKTKADFETTIRQIDVLEKGITQTRAEIEKNGVFVENIQKKLSKLAGANLAAERRRRELYVDLHKLFDSAVGKYREQLRKRVEADATRLFKTLTTEKDYAGLRINDSYGLTIVHNDGADIPVRSAGAEHVVALCLMGALQNNAPLRGPILIDSPFGRLDRGHTRNIVRALPSMTKQVVLLVYEDELPANLAREELKTKLRGEWRLERRTARYTELVPRKD